MGEFARSLHDSSVSEYDRASDDLPEEEVTAATRPDSGQEQIPQSSSDPSASVDFAPSEEDVEEHGDASEDFSTSGTGDSETSASEEVSSDSHHEESSEDAPDQEPSSAAAQKAEEVASVTSVRSSPTVPGGDDSGLSGFFDTLDERARRWWMTYRARRAEKKRQAQLAAEAARHAPAEPLDSSALARPPSGPRHAHARRLFDEVPVLEVIPQIDAASDASSLLSPPSNNQGVGDAPEQDASPEDTTVLPAYSFSPPPPPPRVRHALDEQRRRDVIVQKARAIEDATDDEMSSSQFADDEEDLYTYIPPYNLPSRDTDPEPTRVDLARRITVSVGALAALVSTFWMLGWFGTSEEAPSLLPGSGFQGHHSQGWFSGEHALLSPDYAMYWLWPIITLGTLCHAAFQWTASQISTPRQQRSGWMVAGASLLMLPMTAAMHFGLFTVALISSVASALMLTEAVRQFNLYTARTSTERRFTDGVVGLFFGFALVQAGSAVSIWLTVHQWHIPGIPPLLWAGIGLLACVWTGAYYSMTERGRITIALGLGWGMFWLIFPRLLGEVTSVWVAIGAAMAAFIVILSTQSRRHRINHAERRAAMGRPLEDII